MYRSHFNLKEKPFESTPDPDFIWLGEKQIEAATLLKQEIQRQAGILVLTGDTGMGKSTFVNYIIRGLKDRIVSVQIPYPDLDEHSFFEFIHNEFSLGAKFERKGQFLYFFGQYLRKLSDRKKCAIIIIDDAQYLNPQTIEAILFMAKLEIDGKKIVNILLIGQSEKKEKFLDRMENDIKKNIVFSYHFEALTRTETHQYICHRMEIAGAVNNIFEPEAIDMVHLVSAGCPRLINIICDNALLYGYSEGNSKIEKNLIVKSCKELRPV